MIFRKKNKNRTIEEIINSMNEEQVTVCYYLVYKAYEDGKKGAILPSTISDRFKELGFPGYSDNYFN